MFNFHSKNIIILFKSFVLGGAEKQGLYLANYLQNQKNCKVYIYSHIKSPNTTLFYEECEKYNLKNLYIVKNPLSASGRFMYVKRRIKIALFGLKLRKHKPDIIIPYLNPPSIIAALCFKIAGAKITFWHHRGVDYFRNDSLEKIATKKAPLFIANSPNGQNELLDILKSPKEKTYFLPNFSTIESINLKKNIKLLDDLKDKIIIGMLAHFRAEKMQDVLLMAFYELSKKYQNSHLILAGTRYKDERESIFYQNLQSFIKSHELENKISILHNMKSENIIPYLDIGVLISRQEGMPNIITEYMAYGLPVICTKHAGCVSLLGQDYPFYIEDNNDIESITSKLEALVKDKSLRKNIGKDNATRLQKDFLIETYIDKLSGIINQI